MRRILISGFALSSFWLAACPAQVTQGGTTTSPIQAAKSGARSCADAALSLSESDVVAVIDGESVSAAALGKELAQAEKAALHEYCSSVSRLRKQALDEHINDILVKRQAGNAGQDVDSFVRARLDPIMNGTPSEEEIQAFYQARSGPGVPPLEQVRPQVIAAVQREKAEKAVKDLFASLRSGVQIQTRLPDVRPPAQEIDLPAYTATAGAVNATVQVVEFADFECPYCSIAANNLNQLKERFKGKSVSFSFRHFPLSFHPNAKRAAEFTQCAQAQGKFWQLHDKIFANAKAMDEASLRKYAKEVGLVETDFDACLKSGTASQQVESDMKRAQELGVNGTPTFFVNGRKVEEPSAEGIAAVIEAELQGS